MKYAIRNFFFALLISLVVSAAVGLLIFGSLKGDIENLLGLSENTTSDTSEEVVELKTSASFLIVGRDHSGAADTLLLAKINKAKKQFIFITVPTSITTKIDGSEKTIKSISSYESVDYLKKKTEALTGIAIDYTVDITAQNAIGLIDFLGGVEVDVPKSVYSKSDDYTLDIKKGKQKLDGEKAVHLIEYTDYKDGDKSRLALYRSLIESLAESTLTDERRENVSNSTLHNFYEFIDTDFTVNNFITNITSIFNYHNCKVISEGYAGTYSNSDGKITCKPDIETALDKFATFR